MAYLIVSNDPPKDYENFIAKSLEEFKKHKIKGFAIVALLDEGQGVALTGYWNMSLSDKAIASQQINFDAVDQMIRANADRYKDLFAEMKAEESGEGSC